MFKKQQQIEKIRIVMKQKEIRLTIFACKRCFVKFSNNTKFHQHICDHYTKKSKFVVSNSFFFILFFTTFDSIIFLFDNSKFVSQSKILFIFSITLSQSIFFSIDNLKFVSQSKILLFISFFLFF